MTAQIIINQLLLGFLSILFIFLLIFILYRYIEYRQTEEFQEYKLFKSEYKTHKKKRKNLVKKFKNLEKEINRLKRTLAKDLLDKELEATPIDVLTNAWKIGEGTVLNLYSSGYRTLKDLDNVSRQKLSRLEYIGEVRSHSIKNWVEKYKNQRKERIVNEIDKGFHSNTMTGQKIENVKAESSRCKDKIKKVSFVLSQSKGDFKRYHNVSFVNFLLEREIRVPFKKIYSPELKGIEDLLQEILGTYSVVSVKNPPKEELRRFYNEVFLIRKEHPHGYKGLIMQDGISPYSHFLLIHAEGISFVNLDYIETVCFKDIMYCSKFVDKILLSLKGKKRESIEFRKDAIIAYEYIKTLKK